MDCVVGVEVGVGVSRGGRNVGSELSDVGGRMVEGCCCRSVEIGGGLKSARFRFAGTLSEGGRCMGIGVGVDVLMRLGRPLIALGTALGVGVGAGLLLLGGCMVSMCDFMLLSLIIYAADEFGELVIRTESNVVMKLRINL